jgi:hypothetical protein
MKVNTNLAIIATLSVLAFYLTLKLNSKKEPPKEAAVTLSSTDTIYKQIDSLEVISDTIKIYYETKVKNYTILPTPERVRLFAERINR